MDAASQLQHYGSMHSSRDSSLNPTPMPPGSSPPTPSSIPQPTTHNPQPSSNTPQSNSYNHDVTSTMSENRWPSPPVGVNATPPPVTPNSVQPIEPFDAQGKPTTHNTSSLSLLSAGLQPTTYNSHHFPFMIVTMLVMVALVGFGGSFLYFKSKGVSQNVVIAPLVTPPVTTMPEDPRPKADQPMADNANPFAQPEASESANPFAQDGQENPFDNVTAEESATQAAYTNPFDNK